MLQRGLFSVLALLASTVSATAADPGVMSDVRVTVRTYDVTDLPAETRATALATAADILRSAGVDVEWMECDGVFVRQGDNPCLAPLRRTELSVRFVRFPPPPGHHGILPLGYALVDTRRQTGVLATMYVDRVAGLAATCEVDFGRLLGRAVAHEIGHLLLGTAQHADNGLMQAFWSRESIRGSADAQWVFTAREARGMRDALRVRAAEQVAMLELGIRNSEFPSHEARRSTQILRTDAGLSVTDRTRRVATRTQDNVNMYQVHSAIRAKAAPANQSSVATDTSPSLRIVSS